MWCKKKKVYSIFIIIFIKSCCYGAYVYKINIQYFPFHDNDIEFPKSIYYFSTFLE